MNHRTCFTDMEKRKLDSIELNNDAYRNECIILMGHVYEKMKSRFPGCYPSSMVQFEAVAMELSAILIKELNIEV